MLTRSSRLADQAAASTTDAPLRRCHDCELNLGAGPGVTLRAAFACPMFGQPRHGVESRCVAFVPKDSGALLLPNVPTPHVDCSSNPELCR